jgi:hypothetical protein
MRLYSNFSLKFCQHIPQGHSHNNFLPFGLEGWLLMSIPYQWIPTITQNLKEMKWVLPGYTLGREKFIQFDQ